MAKSKIQINMEEIRARALADLQKKGAPRITAQAMFLTIARAMGNRVRRHAIADLTACKPVIRAMITAGEIIFKHVEGGTSFYTIPSVNPRTGNSAHAKGQGTFDLDQSHYAAGQTIHEQAGRLMEDGAYRERMQEEAYREFRKHHTWKNRAETLLTLTE